LAEKTTPDAKKQLRGDVYITPPLSHPIDVPRKSGYLFQQVGGSASTLPPLDEFPGFNG
jgi:hypothetical protein